MEKITIRKKKGGTQSFFFTIFRWPKAKKCFLHSCFWAKTNFLQCFSCTLYYDEEVNMRVSLNFLILTWFFTKSCILEKINKNIEKTLNMQMTPFCCNFSILSSDGEPCRIKGCFCWMSQKVIFIRFLLAFIRLLPANSVHLVLLALIILLGYLLISRCRNKILISFWKSLCFAWFIIFIRPNLEYFLFEVFKLFSIWNLSVLLNIMSRFSFEKPA